MQDSLFFERELLSFETEWYEQQLTPLNGARIVPNKVDTWSLTQGVVARMVTKYGNAAWVNGGALDPQDIPAAGASVSEDIKQVREYATSAIFSNDEIAVASRLGRPIDMWQTGAALEAMARHENDFIFNGDTGTGIKGLWTSGLIGTTAATTGDWDDPTTTSAEIYADLVQMTNFIMENTDTARMERVRIVLPVAAYNRAESTVMSTTDSRSVLNVFLGNMGSKVESITFAQEFDAQKEALVFVPNERYMRHHIVMPAMRLAPFQLVNGYKVFWRARTAGIIVQNSTTQRRFTGMLV